MKRPLTGVVVVFMLGIGAGAALAPPLGVLALSAAILVASFWPACRPNWSLAVALALVFVAGAASYRARTADPAAGRLVALLGAEHRPVTVRGRIVSDAAGRPSFFLATDQALVGNVWEPVADRLFVYLRDLTVADDRRGLRYGDVVECTMIVRPPQPTRNPGVFDFAGWLARKQVRLVGHVTRHDVCRIIERNRGHPVRSLALAWRARLHDALQPGLATEPRLAGVLAGMVLGERAEIPPATYAAFQQAGAFHVFAISGLHVSLVTGVVLIVLRLLRLPRRWCGVVAIPLLILYVFATGARPGALRALAMACVWLCGWALARPTDLINTLAAAALLILVADPTQLFDGGFILSFTVVGALVTLTPRLEAPVQRWLAPDPLLPETLVPGWRKKLRGPAQWLARLVAGSVASWLGLIPLMALYFNLFTPISVFANLIAVPVLGGIITVGLLAIMSHPLWPGLAEIFNNTNFLLLHVMLRSVESLGRLPGGHWYVQAPPWWLAAMYYGVGAAALWPGGGRARWRWAAGAALPPLVLAGWWLTRDAPAAEVTVLDLTQGSAVFVDLPGERHDFLVGVGDDRGAERVTLPFLRRRGVDRLGAVWITRGTKAHLGGFDELADALPIRRVLHSGWASRSPAYTEWTAALEARGIPATALTAPRTMPLTRQVAVHVLHPPADWRAPRSQDNTLVLLFEVAGQRLLLMSDSGETVEQALLERGVDVRAEILIKGRHGLEPSATDAFLDAVQPRLVVLAAPARFGRRTQTELDVKLRRRGIELHRTDEHGAAILWIDRQGYSLRPAF